ncbi:hypothetical protein [Paenibacillus lactis]|uniref:hypothetical protein n=1 Tax=Paenibacillus lactis TaxID=228574 RepID=UPI00119D8855
MLEKEEGKDMIATPATSKAPKPIPKNQIGLTNKQKNILKSFVGKSPKLPAELNEVREWEKYGEGRF